MFAFDWILHKVSYVLLKGINIYVYMYLYSTMSKYVLYYSGAKALGEPPRLLLSFGGQEFEDVRLTMEQWPEFKPSK